MSMSYSEISDNNVLYINNSDCSHHLPALNVDKPGKIYLSQPEAPPPVSSAHLSLYATEISILRSTEKVKGPI